MITHLNSLVLLRSTIKKVIKKFSNEYKVSFKLVRIQVKRIVGGDDVILLLTTSRSDQRRLVSAAYIIVVSSMTRA